MEWKTEYIAKLPKKGDLSDCQNWRGIQLLSLPSKVFTRLVLKRIRKSVDIKLREERARFRAHRSYTNQIVTLCIIIELSLEWQSPLHVSFVNIKKLFDTVERTVIRRILTLWHSPEDR